MTIQLTDDGTMDTVLKCSECGEEFRYNYDPTMEQDGLETDEQAYDGFVAWAIEDATGEHECVTCPNCEGAGCNNCDQSGAPNS